MIGGNAAARIFAERSRLSDTWHYMVTGTKTEYGDVSKKDHFERGEVTYLITGYRFCIGLWIVHVGVDESELALVQRHDSVFVENVQYSTERNIFGNVFPHSL